MSDLAPNSSVYGAKSLTSLHNNFLVIRAAHPRHARAIGPVRRLAGLSDDAEDLRFGEMEDGQPVEPLAAGAGVAFASFPGNALCAIAALVAAQPEGAHDAAFEARMVPEVAPELALDGSALRAGRAVSASRIGKPAPLLDVFEKCLAGGDPRENQRHARRNRVSNMRLRLGPLDLTEGRVDDEELLRGYDAREQDRHRLAVLASAARDGDERAAVDEIAAFARHEEAGPVREGRRAGHARCPSWSVSTMSSVMETNRGRSSYSGSPPSSAGGRGLTATMAAAGAPPQKHENSAKLSCSPLASAAKTRRCSSVMLVVMAIPVWKAYGAGTARRARSGPTGLDRPGPRAPSSRREAGAGEVRRFGQNRMGGPSALRSRAGRIRGGAGVWTARLVASWAREVHPGAEARCGP